jgi:serine phosphatase RsbU (regulator of sigma subunit)
MADAPRHPTRGARRIYPVVVWVVAWILAVAGVLSAFAWQLNDNTEHRLLREQLQQAGGTLSGAGNSVRQSLAAAAIAAAAPAPASTNVAAFLRIADPIVGPDRQFASVSLWAPDATDPIVVFGKPPALLQLSEAQRRVVLRNSGAGAMTVINLLFAPTPRLGFAVHGDEESQRLVAYGESVLPENHAAVPQVGESFENVDYALYLGDAARRDALVYASTPQLPLEGSRETMIVPYGNTDLRLEFASRANLAGWLSTNLYWIIAVSGIVLAAVAGLTLQWVATRRDRAAALAAENAELYREQRNIAVTLQHSLLPEQLGGMPDIEVVARYEPAAERTEVGGDWYDAMPVPGGSLFVVVGDVSGHGIKAAATMASLRFAARAYAADGCDPALVLTKLGMLLDVRDGAEFATVLCARLDPARSKLLVADAGHPSPVLVDVAGARFVEVPHGPPIGVPNGDYKQVELDVADEGTLVAFTDGLVERRGEPIDDGLDRLLDAIPTTDGSLADLISTLADTATHTGRDDDLAILGVRWTTTRT